MQTGQGTAPKRARLLVVDDEEELLQIFAEFLGDAGFELDLARTGDEAIEKLDTKRFDLVVTDLNLPGADGLTILRHARAVDPQLEVIMLTGNASIMTAVEALRQGAYDYVLKPFDLFEMDQTIHKALERRQLLDQNSLYLDTLQKANADLQKSQEDLRRHRDELKQRVEEATRRIRTLYEVGKEITSSLHLERTLKLILEKSLGLTGATEGALFLVAESTGLPECRVLRGVDERSGSWKEMASALDTLNGKVLDGKEAVRASIPCVPTVPTVPLREGPGNGEALSGQDGSGSAGRSVLVVPILQEGEVTGMVGAFKAAPEEFSAEEQEVLVSLTAQASIAIHNARVYEKIRDLERLKSEFVAVVSHEVRTPLTAIKGSLEILADEKYFSVPEPQRQLLSISQANVARLETLINDILDFSKLESSRLSNNFVETTLGTLSASAMLNLSNLAEQKRIRLLSEIPADLPTVRADDLRITQVLTNLLSNAIKFSPEESEIRILASVRDRGIEVEIRDQGIGIPPEDLPKLFTRFRQLDSSSTRKAGGTGLGLVISKGIVEEHGGKIWANSIPDQGSSFYFWLPLEECLAPESTETSRQEGQPVSS